MDEEVKLAWESRLTRMEVNQEHMLSSLATVTMNMKSIGDDVKDLKEIKQRALGAQWGARWGVLTILVGIPALVAAKTSGLFSYITMVLK